MMRHTGGTALGETSTRSSPESSAERRASTVGMTPSCVPSAPMTRTSGTRMRRLTRYDSVGGALGLAMVFSPCSGDGRDGRLVAHLLDECFDRQRLELLAVIGMTWRNRAG